MVNELSITMTQFSPKARKKSRTLLVQALYQWQMTDGDLVEVEAQFRAHQDMGGADSDYFSDALRFIIKEYQQLDSLIKPYSEIDLKQLDPVEHAVLWLASYELSQRIDIPYKVVINEAIEQAKQFGATDGHKYINGTLDKLAKQLRALEMQ